MSAKLAVWDVDGTLVDSRAVIFDACTEAVTAMGLPAPAYDAVRHVVGLSLREAMQVLAGELGPAQVDRAVERYKAAFQERHRQPGFIEPLYAGAADSLERLRSAGWRLAIATGKSRRGVETILRMHGWGELFGSTHCADDGPGKPHPAMLLAAMKVMDARPQDTVMIGDTSHDMSMARAAGVRAQGVSWGFQTAEEVRAAGADHVAEDFAQLDAALAAFGRTGP